VFEEVAYKKIATYTKANVETDVTMYLRELISLAMRSKANLRQFDCCNRGFDLNLFMTTRLIA